MGRPQVFELDKGIIVNEGEFNRHALDFSVTLTDSTSLRDASRLFEAELRTMGVTGLFYGMTRPTAEGAGFETLQAYSTHDPEFVDLYTRKNFACDDPFVNFCLSEPNGMIRWSDPRAMSFATDRSDQVLGLAHDYGMSHGISIALRSANSPEIGGIGLTLDACDDRAEQEILRRHGQEIETAVALFHNHLVGHLIGRDSQASDDGKTAALTQREKECLMWCAAGLRTKEIAYRMSISEKTVEFHLSNVGKRLNARNRTHAVARALSYGLIDI